MTLSLRRLGASLAVMAMITVPTACSQEGGVSSSNHHPNSIQPETTLSIAAQATVEKEPDMAWLNSGVQTEAPTARQAIADNAKAMSSVFAALKAAGIAEKDMQTSNFSLQPRYDYSRDGRPPRLTGYTASNQLRIKIRDLDKMGEQIDAFVSAGSNQMNGISFALDDPSEAQDEARREAMTIARQRAELYAAAAGMKVKRIVSISEGGGFNPGPMPVMAMRSAEASMSTPIASGEVSYSISVNVLYELGK